MQLADDDEAVAQLTELVKLEAFDTALLDVLLKDAMQRGTLPSLRRIVRRLFDLCHCRKGSTPSVDISKLRVSSGTLLRLLVQMHAAEADAEASAKEQLERSIGQPCAWDKFVEGSPDLQLAGATVAAWCAAIHSVRAMNKVRAVHCTLHSLLVLLLTVALRCMLCMTHRWLQCLQLVWPCDALCPLSVTSQSACAACSGIVHSQRQTCGRWPGVRQWRARLACRRPAVASGAHMESRKAH